jgi:hypothetical protein
MHQGTDQEDAAAGTPAGEARGTYGTAGLIFVIKNEVIAMNDRELKRVLHDADRWDERDDFYREQVIEEQLDDDCIDEEEVAFMMGYLAA